MKKLLLIALLFSSTISLAQVEKTVDLQKSLSVKNKDTVAWVYGGVLNVGFNQGFLHNWAAGGELASLTVNGLFNGYLNRLFHRSIWSNNLDLNYGLFYAYSNSFIPRKIDDRIDFTSKYGYRLDKKKDFYLTTLFNFKSQFTQGFDYEIPKFDTMPTSNAFSPAYFIFAQGLEYREGNNLTIFFSPIAARLTIADALYTSRKPEGAFGIENGKTSRFELGAYFSGRYLVNIMENMTYRTRVDLYMNYLAKDVKDAAGNVVKEDNPGNVDVLWDNLFSYKINKSISLALGATFIYDNDLPYEDTFIDANGVVQQKDELGSDLGWIQIKQLFTLGFQYKF